MPETLRPELHATADQGILDAPAAMLHEPGDTTSVWHQFHQYRPALGQPSRWGHLTSEETPFDWDLADDVVAPQGHETTVRAGSVVTVGKGENAQVHLYFTSVTDDGCDVHIARIAQTELNRGELSDDPRALNPHVERLGSAIGEAAGLTDFRSPCVVADWSSDDRSQSHDGWLMTAVTGPVDSPIIAVAHSDDGLIFDVLGPLQFEGTTGFENETSIVSPRIIRLKDEVDGLIYDIVFLTIEHDDKDISGYVVGTLSGTVFTISRPFTRLDYGHTFTRPRSSSTAGSTDYSSTVVVGLMSDSPGRRTGEPHHPTLDSEGWAGCISLPRTTTLQNGVLYQTPPRGLMDAITRTSKALSWTGLCEVEGEDSSICVELIDAKDNIAATICHHGDSITLDRSATAYHKNSSPAIAPLAEGDTDTLTVIVDGSAVEVFADGGLIAMASRVIFDGGCTDIRVTTTGNSTVHNSFSRSSRSLTAEALPEWLGEEFQD